jgi:predicted DNA-binding protein with PD1-like motif
MKTLPIRLTPGQDLRAALEAAVLAHHCRAAFVLGGHVAPGCIVLTTAEVLLALLPDWQFTREPDALTGYDELVTRSLR